MEGTSPGEDRAALAACVPLVRRLVGHVHQIGSAELEPLFGEIEQLEAALGGLVTSAGSDGPGGACPPDPPLSRPGLGRAGAG